MLQIEIEKGIVRQATHTIGSGPDVLYVSLFRTPTGAGLRFSRGRKERWLN